MKTLVIDILLGTFVVLCVSMPFLMLGGCAFVVVHFILKFW